jgi:mono/diheme cytochrome c family protein
MIRSCFLIAVVELCLVGCGNDHGYGIGGDDVDGGDNLPSDRAGLPCDVQTFLADNCQSCHGTKRANGVPMSLVTYRDLIATNADGVMIAQRVLARITDPEAQMPPLPAPTVAPADVAMFESWVNTGMPTDDCVAQPGPFDGPSVCTSGKTWTGGNSESPLMHPGVACVACHARSEEGPRFGIAGTVYPSGHEPNDCYGATSAAVEVTDANHKVFTLPVNASGNFMTSSLIAFPIQVAVVANGKRRSMTASPPNGDCNSCHTQNGADDAPGRIALP